MGLTEMLAAAKEREANAGSLSAAAAAPAPAASVVVHKILRIPRVDAKVGVGDDDDDEDDDDAALRARCRRLHAEFAAKVEHLRDHQDLLLEAVRARSETESRRLSQGGD